MIGLLLAILPLGADDCVGVDCGSGTCEDLVNDYRCDCTVDKTGQHCEAGNMFSFLAPLSG